MSKAPAILLNKTFFSSLKNKKWIKEQGADAVLILLSFWIESSNEPGCKVHESDIELLQLHLPTKPAKVLEVLRSAVEAKLIDYQDGFFFNSQTVQDHDSYKQKSRNYSEGRKKALRKQGESSEDSQRIQEENREDSSRTPTCIPFSIIPKGSYFLDLDLIKLTKEQFDGFAVNHLMGDEARARALCEAASDHLKSKGQPMPSDCAAYMRGWLRKDRQFSSGKSDYTQQKKQTAHEKNMARLAQLRAEESENAT